MPTDVALVCRPALPRGLWRRRIVEALTAQLTQGITPRRIALSFAVGSLCAFFPVLGAATPLCVAAAALLRLNQPLVQLVNGLTSPLYPFLWLAFVRVGETAAGAPHQTLQLAVLTALWRTPWRFFHIFGAALGHAVLGWFVLAPVWIALAYGAVLPAVRLATRGPAGRRNRSAVRAVA